MKTSKASRLLLILFALLTFFFQSHTAGAFVDEDMVMIQALIQKIDARRHAWFGMQADIKMSFTTAQNQNAGCAGKLTYLRLDEKIYLECYNQEKQPVFIFKTSDVQFELYLPLQKKLFKGNIFDLENNDEIHSHIKPFDLYRAFKPLPLNAEEITIDQISGNQTTLMVWSNDGTTDFVKRKVTANNSGHVIIDQFLNSANKVEMEIRRSDYRKIELHNKNNDFIYMPHDIRIIDAKSSQTTQMRFSGMQLLWAQPAFNWNFDIPADTEIFTFPEIQTAPKRQTYFN